MSQRLGMADGRCFTIHTNPNLLNDAIMHGAGIPLQDNYTYRQFLQTQGPEVLSSLIDLQTSEKPGPNSISCQACNLPLLKVKTPY